jgi:1-deoxy-D-xylulose-5-phosphate reductoisomerase
MKKKITILGSTGSIGLSTLDVVEQHPAQYEVFALTAYKQVEALIEQCLRFKPRYAVLLSDQAAKLFREKTTGLKLTCELLVGEEALCQVASASEVDMVMAAIVGAAGLRPVLAALQADKKVLLANKEPLVMAGDLVLKTLANSQGRLIPVDSEHSAIFQCLPEGFLAGRLFPDGVLGAPPHPRSLSREGRGMRPPSPLRGEGLGMRGRSYSQTPNYAIAKIVLTASGGATRDLALEKLQDVTPEFACTHPNWSMGKKITLDSATMMNKALEVIEAYYLFGVPADHLEVLLHPQSIIHSMVYYEDASVIAQLGQPDMRTPIAYAMAWPNRIATTVPPLDLTKMPLTFQAMDLQRYPCLMLAYEALRKGGCAANVLNAANEIAVERFLNHEILFTDIYRLNAEVLAAAPEVNPQDLTAIQAIDQEARIKAHEWSR